MAAVVTVALVATARALMTMTESDAALYCAIAILFPGMVLNLLMHGVHGSWDDPLSEFFTVGIPAIGWFVLIRALLGAMVREKQPNQTTRDNARDLT